MLKDRLVFVFFTLISCFFSLSAHELTVDTDLYGYDADGQIQEVITSNGARIAGDHGHLNQLLSPSVFDSLEDDWEKIPLKEPSHWESLASMVNSVINYMTHDLSLYHSLKHEIDEVANQTFGKLLLEWTGYYLDSPEVGVYGNGELNEKIRLTMINGILNVRNDYAKTLKMLSRAHGNCNIHYVFYPTEGFVLDFYKSIFVRYGFISFQSEQLAKEWKALIEELGGVDGGGLIIHYAHSIGGCITYNAKNFLTPEEQKMIRIITLGSPLMIPNEDFHSVCNYISKRDYILFLCDPFRHLKTFMDSSSNINYIGTHFGIPFDHLIEMETYQKAFQVFGKEFLELYVNGELDRALEFRGLSGLANSSSGKNEREIE